MSALSWPRFARANRRRSTAALWFERGMAMLAIANLLLVCFDLSYIPFRDLYLKVFPGVTHWYGETFKGIEPERTTTAYLTQVDALSQQLEISAVETREVGTLLANLRDRSVTLIDENPFQIANKSGTLERIKRLIAEHMAEEDSFKDAFRQFWSTQNFNSQDAQAELAFFNQQIRPLIETNYWRRIDFNSLPVDRFWIIDAGFVALFGLEFIARTYYLSRRYENITWLDAMLWRLYDLPLFLPAWRWLRIIPVIVRANHSGLVDLEPLRSRLNRVLISQFAVELTEVVFLRMLDQSQNLIREGQVSRWLFEATSESRYIDLNGVDELQTIAQHLSDLIVRQVLPEIKPDLDAILSHSVNRALDQTPPYQGLKFLPGFIDLSHQLTQQISAEVSKNLYSTIQQVLADEKGADLIRKLIQSFSGHLREELQSGNTLQEIQSLITDLLEEVKVNYVTRIAQEGTDKLQENSYRLYSATQQRR